MRDIGIFEFEKHPFFLYYISQIANTEVNDVTVIVPQSMRDRIRPLYTDDEYGEFRWILSDEDENQDDFFDRAERIASDELDFLWVNTAWGTGRTPINYLEFDPDCPSVAGVTNLNDWAYNPFPRFVYASVPSAVRLVKRAPSAVSTPICRHLRYLMQPGILANHDGVNVEYPPMRRYAEVNGDWNLPIYGLAPVVYEPEKIPDTDDVDGLRVAIPGRISSNIRDYDLVFEAMEPLFEEHGDALSLDLVGQPRGASESVIETANGLAQRGFEVTYRTEWVPFVEFAEALARADLLLDPVEVHRRIRHPLRQNQQTGRRNGTGIVFDAIRYARPLLLPEQFPVDESIDSLSRTYRSTADLRSTLRTFLESEPTLRSFQKATLTVAKQYDCDTQGPRFDAIVEDVRDRSPEANSADQRS